MYLHRLIGCDEGEHEMETGATGGGQQGTTSAEEGEREVQYPRIPSVSDSQPVGHDSFWGGLLNNQFTGVT